MTVKHVGGNNWGGIFKSFLEIRSLALSKSVAAQSAPTGNRQLKLSDVGRNPAPPWFLPLVELPLCLHHAIPNNSPGHHCVFSGPSC